MSILGLVLKAGAGVALTGVGIVGTSITAAKTADVVNEIQVERAKRKAAKTSTTSDISDEEVMAAAILEEEAAEFEGEEA